MIIYCAGPRPTGTGVFEKQTFRWGVCWLISYYYEHYAVRMLKVRKSFLKYEERKKK